MAASNRVGNEVIERVQAIVRARDAGTGGGLEG